MRDWERGEFNVFGLGKQHLLPSSFDISFYRFCYVVLCYAAFLQPCEIKNIDIREFNKNTAAIERDCY